MGEKLPRAQRLERTATFLVRGWVRLYTAGLPAAVRDRRRTEIESQVWEQLQDGRREGHGRAATSARMLVALLAGSIDDVAWRRATVRAGRASGRSPVKPLAGVADDVRHSLRALVKSPHVSTAILLVLALGIGLNTAIFSFLETTVTNPFPFPDGDRLVDIVRGSHQRASGPFNYAAFATFRDNNDVFAGVAGYRDRPATVVVGDHSRSLRGAAVTADLFETLGVRPLLGRTFTAEEEGRSGAPVAIISHYLWETGFDGDPEVLGTVFEIEGVERTIVGVMPRGFKFYEGNAVWVPLPVDATTPLDDPYRLSAVGRLRPDVSLAQAQASVAGLDEALDPLLGEPLGESERLRRASGFRLAPLSEGLMIPGRIVLGIALQVAAGFVMAVLGANLAGLMLARGIARRPEIAVRRALGAPRRRLVRQVLIENLLLSLGGAVMGVILVVWGYELFVAVIPMLTGTGLRLDGRILLFATGISTLAVLVFGSQPMLELCRTPPHATLKEGGGATSSLRAKGWQNRLVVLQIALSVIFLVGASLVARSILAVGDVDPGFDADGVFQVVLSSTDPMQSRSSAESTLRIAEALSTTPGIAAVAWRGNASPAVAGTTRDLVGGFIETRDGPSGLAARFAARRGPVVSADYFDAFGLSLLRGRLFDDRDRANAPIAAVLSERAARILWPGREAVGRELRWPGGATWVIVVGVVSNITQASRDSAPSGPMGALPSPDIYLSATQFDNQPANNVLWVRAGQDRTALPQLVRRRLSEIEPGVEAWLIESLWQAEYGRLVNEYGSAGRVLGSLGLIVLLLSSLGTYSVVAYSWQQRSREVGVRLAFGASSRDVVALVLRDGQKLALVGVLSGTAVSAAIYRLLAAVFFGVSPWDPVTYVAVALLLAAVAALAGLGPARRAIRTDPVDILR